MCTGAHFGKHSLNYTKGNVFDKSTQTIFIEDLDKKITI